MLSNVIACSWKAFSLRFIARFVITWCDSLLFLFFSLLFLMHRCNYVSRYVNDRDNYWYNTSGFSLFRPLAFWTAISFGIQTFIFTIHVIFIQFRALSLGAVIRCIRSRTTFSSGFISPLGFSPSCFFVAGSVLWFCILYFFLLGGFLSW